MRCQGNKDAVRSSAAVAELMMSTAECDLLVTHIESLCYFWAQIADQDTAQRMATLTVNMLQAQLPVITGRLQPGTVCLCLSLSLSLCVFLYVSFCVCMLSHSDISHMKQQRSETVDNALQHIAR